NHLENRVITLQSQFQAHKSEWRAKLEKRDAEMKGQEQQLRNEEKASEDQFRSRKDRVEVDFNGRKGQLVKERDHRLLVIAREENEAAQQRDTDRERIETAFQRSLAQQGVNASLIRAAKERAEAAEKNISRI